MSRLAALLLLALVVTIAGWFHEKNNVQALQLEHESSLASLERNYEEQIARLRFQLENRDPPPLERDPATMVTQLRDTLREGRLQARQIMLREMKIQLDLGDVEIHAVETILGEFDDARQTQISRSRESGIYLTEDHVSVINDLRASYLARIGEVVGADRQARPEFDGFVERMGLEQAPLAVGRPERPDD